MEVPPPAGKLLYHLRTWRTITQDPWVLNVIQGYEIPFLENPPTGEIPPFTFSVEESSVISAEILRLQEKGAVTEVASGKGFVSNIFVVPKSDNKWRLILNLKALNLYTQHMHFKMEDIRCVKDLLNRGDYMCKLDLKDAYLSIPIKESHRKFLKFRWQGKIFQYNALPFGLAKAPRVFTKVLKPVLSHLRAKGIRMIAYLDDILLIGKTKEETERAFRTTVTLLEELGFVVNSQKSLSRATQVIEFLGFVVDSRSMQFRLPHNKVKAIKKSCKQMLQVQTQTVRQLAHLLVGVLTATRLAVIPAPLHYRGLQALKVSGLVSNLSYETQVTLDARSCQDLRWWANEMEHHNGRPIHMTPPSVVIESDASNSGWGACYNNQRTGGQWSHEETQLHINVKELLAAFLALQTFVGSRRGIHVHLKMDNTTAVFYVNNMGGTHSQVLVDLTSQIWDWAMDRDMTLTAEYLPGRLNVRADHESRLRGDSSEWKLDPRIFRQIMKMVGQCDVDLFASRLSTQLPKYMSWKPDPGALATDALNQPWGNINSYAFPPFSLIGRCLSKIRREEVQRVVLIAPLWTAQPWFPDLMRMLYREPILLPSHNSLLRNHRNERHPMGSQLNLVAWPVSGVASKTKAFQSELQLSFFRHGGSQQRKRTRVAGEGGSNGATSLDSIPFVHL